MEEAKLKQIELKLFELLSQLSQPGNQNATPPKKNSDVKVIRRRKGKPDVFISRKAGDLC